MRHVRLGRDAHFSETPSGEMVAVLVGRHERHGAAQHHTVAVVELAPGAASDPNAASLTAKT